MKVKFEILDADIFKYGVPPLIISLHPPRSRTSEFDGYMNCTTEQYERFRKAFSDYLDVMSEIHARCNPVYEKRPA